VIRLDTLEKQVKSTYLSIGSNIGDKFKNIERAINLLNKNNILIDKISSYYETPSWPKKNFPKFLNIVLKIRVELSLNDLFKIIKKIEKQLGRKKAPRNYPRICDIDIIDFKGLCMKTKLNNNKIETPHPRMKNRNFVLFPLYEVNNTWIHPKTKENIHSIINQFKNEDFSDIKIVLI